MGRLILVICALLLAGCGSGSAASQGHRASHHAPQNLTVGMGYIPSVQFAPFYVAQAHGYYRQAGLNVHFQYAIEPDLLRLASEGKVDLVNAGGDEVLAAGAQGLHVTYIMTEYSRFPTALFSLKSSGIRTPAQLRGHSIGIPGAYGASYVGLLALLQHAGVPQSAVRIMSIGFSQVSSVANHKVDAAVGYATNEPVEIQHEGYQINEMDVYKYANIAGAGMAAGNSEIAKHPAAVRAFVRATLHGLSDTLANPATAFAITLKAVPQLAAQRSVQRAVLQRSLDFWRAEPGHPLGWVDPAIWARTAHLLYQFKQIPRAVSPARYYTNRFIAR
jgi:NitT/TauT family transport system substrate-binding protein